MYSSAERFHEWSSRMIRSRTRLIRFGSAKNFAALEIVFERAPELYSVKVKPFPLLPDASRFLIVSFRPPVALTMGIVP